MADQKNGKKESKVEAIKRGSRYMRGQIAENLTEDTTHFPDDQTQLLKFHGIYQQDNRDERHERRKQKQEEAWQFMIRCAIPGGAMTAEQYLRLDELADRYAGGALRVTTRQGCQFHGVIKKNLKATMQGINESLLTTLAACGDVERNVMACPAPLADAAHVTVRRVAREIASQLRPRSGAYHEIWLDGEKQLSTEQEEPFYGDQYLPRKFKSGVALAGDNCVDIYNYDLGLVAILDDGEVAGYNVLIGGGMGMTHGKEHTFAMLAQPLGFVSAEHGVDAARTVAAVFRDFGNRADRRHARLKYLLDERGMDWFREEFQRRGLFPLDAWRPMPAFEYHDHLGRNRQDDGHWFYGVFIENGRIRDNGTARMKSALQEIVREHQPGVVFTPHQNVLLTGLTEDQLHAIEAKLEACGVAPADSLSAARRFSMACPALPTCGLALAESERLMPTVVDRFEEALAGLGLHDAPLTMRMTGCPNGCARPYTADIAFVGRRPDVYHVFVGGSMRGDRVADLYAADVPTEELLPTVQPLLASYAQNRRADESLGDFYQRLFKRTEARQKVTGAEEPTMPLISLQVRP